MKEGKEDEGASLIFANLNAKALAAKLAAPEVWGSAVAADVERTGPGGRGR